MKSRGQDFEEDLKRSMPQGVACLKLHTPVPPAYLLKDPSDAAKFTPRQPFDMQFTAPLPAVTVSPEVRIRLRPPIVTVHDIHGGEMVITAKPRLVFSIEVKSTREKRLDFARVKPHQEEGMRAVGALGHVAGLFIEFAAIGGGEVWFLPIENYIAFKRFAPGASIPVDAVRKLGIRIEPNPERGRVNKYYKLGNFLKLFGADVEAEEAF